MLPNIMFCSLKSFVYIFFLAILKTNLLSHHLSKCNLNLNFHF